MDPLRIDLERLLGDASSGRTPGNDVLIALTEAALRETAGDLERLHSRPTRDDTQFGDRPRPDEPAQLDAWLYSSSRRVAHAVLTTDWRPTTAGPPTAAWATLLRDHLHGDFHAGQGWTAVNAVAMPVRRPFDEPGLRVRPLLALWPAVSQDGLGHCSETMTPSVHEGRPYVVPVQVFSAALYLQRLARAGQRWIEIPEQALASRVNT